MRGSNRQVPTSDPGVRCGSSFVGRIDAKPGGGAREPFWLGHAAGGGCHMGMTFGAYTPIQAVRRRMSAEEVEKDLEKDYYFNGRLAHKTS